MEFFTTVTIIFCAVYILARISRAAHEDSAEKQLKQIELERKKRIDELYGRK